MNWLFELDDVDEAAAFFREHGYCGFADAFSEAELEALRDAATGATYSDNDLALTRDVIFVIPQFEEVLRDKRVSGTAAKLIGHPIELYNSRLNSKPLTSETGGVVEWHQDYCFRPHTNYDCFAGLLHLDDETDDSGGPLQMLRGSHLRGPLDHTHEGNFCGKCQPDLGSAAVDTLYCKPGTITFHHGLTAHASGPKTRTGHRRLLIFDFRAQDALQLAGAIHKSTGVELMPRTNGDRVRFFDGTVIPVRKDMRFNEQRTHGAAKT